MRTASVLTGILTLAATAVAVPQAVATSPGPWIPYDQPDVTIAAGTGCDFEVFQKVLRDAEYYRVVSTYPDGTPHLKQWKGPLVMRWTNTETGKSVVVDLSGRATETDRQDGSTESLTVADNGSHFGARMPAGSNLPRGIYRVSGKGSSVRFNEDGTRTITLGPHGTAVNMCGALSG